MDTSKIIKGVVNSGRYTVTAPIVKEDYGLYLQIEGVELPSTYEVDFSNSEHNGTSVTMIGNSDGVLIPSQFISSGKDVFAFLYHVGVDFGRTVYKFRIPNKVRPDRTDEEPTPEEQSTIDQAISALNTAVEQTAQDVIDADQSAQNAYTYALSANAASGTAENFADVASGYASSAQASAESISASASQIATNTADINDLREDLGNRLALNFPPFDKTIPSNSNLNDYLTDGQYKVKSFSVAITITNIPARKGGQLIVQHLTQDGTVLQKYITVGEPTEMYVRYVNTISDPYTFNPWYKIARTEDVEDAVSDKVTLIPSVLDNRISSGDDLNDYLTAGQYVILSQAIAKSLKNKPLEYGHTGTLTVINTHNTNHVYQIIMTNGMSNIWIRHIRIDEQIYDDWKSIANNDVSGYSWGTKDFIVHDPEEENTSMIDCVEKYLGRTIASSEAWATRTNGFRDISSADIYTMWDALQAEYPNYIDAGEIIGYSLDTTGANYAPVKAYYIHPKLKYGTNINIVYDDMPTIYITAGTHGVEGSPTWNLFAIFQRAFQTGTIYTEFLKGIKFRVIPCLSRWSYDHYKRYLAAAYNADGTTKEECVDPETGEIYPAYDANRMCVCSDDNNPSYSNLNLYSYAGEARALTDYMQNHNFCSVNGDSYIDLHNCSYSLGYITGDTTQIQSAFNLMMDVLAKDWYVHSPWKNGDPCYYYGTSTDDHTSLRGKILGRNAEVHSYAWFFEHAYTPFTSNILEVQQYDETSCNRYAIAKGLDITYRWLDYVTKHIRGDGTGNVDDVQINGTSIVQNGVANIPMPKAVTVTGTTLTITAQADTRYVCGEVATLDFTPSTTGICDVVFTSGATATVLTVPNTIKWANGFDPTSLDANTTYEINILDGLGVCCAWT